MVAKTIGFNWGPAGTGCSTWTGVRLADVLEHCGTQGPEQKANYVCFRGPKHELPQGTAFLSLPSNTSLLRSVRYISLPGVFDTCEPRSIPFSLG